MIQIAVDGPSGSGKSTIAKIIADRLNIEYLDTGAMYRAVTLHCINHNVDMNDEDAVGRLLNEIRIEFKNREVFLNKENVSEAIRKPIVAQNVSLIASQKLVRLFLVDMQREIASGVSVIMDGRDIGTHVLVDADYKFYVTASAHERAMRRYKELKDKGENVDFEALKTAIEKRDAFDSQREISPLKCADDATIIDTTEMTIDEVVNKIIEIINIGD